MRCSRRSLLPGLLLVVALAPSLAAADSWRETTRALATPGAREALAARALPLLADGSPALQQARAAGQRAPAMVRAIAIMVAFSDTTFFGHPGADVDPLPRSTQSEIYYAAHDSVFYDHLLGDVADYYAAVSGGRFTFSYTVHGEVVELAQPMAHYGDHPEDGEQPVVLAVDALAAADADIDFSQYDTVILIHAGAGEETDANNDSPEHIYSAYLGLEDFTEAVEDSVLAQPWLETDDHPEGEGVEHVLVLPECEYQDPGPGGSGLYGSLGVYCFELGLRLGMLSLFDFTGNDSQGIGQFGLMGFGLWTAGGLLPPQPCAFNKVLMGWLEPYRVEPAHGEEWTLYPSEFPADPQTCARVDLTGSEYFLIEYRLEDPDGNSDFSFPEGDLNGDGAPNFVDADQPGGVPPLDAVFDPTTDTHERLVDAEWDFFLTGSQGGGSGLLVWHVDEGVIRAVWDAERNLFNGDPTRKSVDLEEADGIQDLDVRESSTYWLGAPVDTWKAEGNDRFGPETRPDTRTNLDAPTGLVIDRISAVVREASHLFNEGEDDEYVGILYHETMTFRCAYADGPDAPPAMIARDLDGVDLSGSHLRAAWLGAGDERPTVVAAADSGRVYAFSPELGEYRDHDDDPATFAPLCVGTGADGAPVAWLPPPVIGQLDADDAGLEIVLAAPHGIYAFRRDGTPVAPPSAPGVSVGLLAAHENVTLPPVLVPAGADESPGAPQLVCVATVAADVDGAPTWLRFVGPDGAEARDPVRLSGVASAAPVRAGRLLFVPIVTPAGDAALQAVSWPVSGPPTVTWSVALDLGAALRPVTVTPTAVLVTDAEGRGQTVHLGADGPRVDPPWSGDVAAASTIGVGGGVLGAGGLGRLGETGVWQTGWPRVPRPEATSGGAEPLALGDPDDPAGFLFATADGRLFLAGADGAIVDGWPLAVPAEQVCTPLVASPPAGGDGDLTILVAGVTPQVAGVDPDTDSLLLRTVSRLRSWSMPVAASLVPPSGLAMYGGEATGRAAMAPLTSPAASSAGSLADTHVCYPQPLRTAVLNVRGQARASGEAEAVIYNLQGEVVARVGPRVVPGGTPFELQVDLEGVASGLYLCKLRVSGAVSMKTIAVER
jgi:M6 family metalloprotease-like protein